MRLKELLVIGIPFFFLILFSLLVFSKQMPSASFLLPKTSKDVSFSLPFITGFNVVSFMTEIGPTGTRKPDINWPTFQEEADESFFAMSEDHATYAALVVRGTQDQADETTISVEGNSISLSSLKTLITLAKKHGITPVIKPHLFVQGASTGRIPIGQTWNTNAQKEKEWFDNYFAYLLPYLQISEQEHLPFFVIATELPNIVIDTPQTGTRRDKEWRDLITRIRGIYHGKLTYASNSTTVADITWWDALDFIGVDAYYTLSDKDVPTYEDIMQGWIANTHIRTRRAFNQLGKEPINIVAKLEEISTKFHRPIVFTEIGYRSSEGASAYIVNHTDVTWVKQPIDQQLQANLFRALFDTFRGKEWFKGYFIWSWYPGNIDETNGSYKHTHPIQGKQAEDVIRTEYEGYAL